MVTDLDRVVAILKSSPSYLEVFGVSEGGKSSQAKHLKQGYRRLAKILHPDGYTDQPSIDLASEAFSILQGFHAQAETAVANGTYGESPGSTVTTKRFTHLVQKLFTTGDLADVMFAESTISHSSEQVKSVVKLARSPRDNDLLIAEAQALKRLRRTGSDESLHPYVPRLLETFKLVDGKRRRQANVLERLEGFYTLEQVLQANPKGLDPLDMAWIWRRVLVAIGFAHEQETIHGAVLPSHVMILPEQHGVVLIDWSYSVKIEDDIKPIRAISPEYRDWYPEEVVNKHSPGKGTDLGMAAQTMIYLLGGDPITLATPKSVPKAFRAFFRGCVQPRQVARPQDAWMLLKEFDELLESLGGPYFPRRFRAFSMPNGMEHP